MFVIASIPIGLVLGLVLVPMRRALLFTTIVWAVGVVVQVTFGLMSNNPEDRLEGAAFPFQLVYLAVAVALAWAASAVRSRVRPART